MIFFFKKMDMEAFGFSGYFLLMFVSTKNLVTLSCKRMRNVVIDYLKLRDKNQFISQQAQLSIVYGIMIPNVHLAVSAKVCGSSTL